MPTVCLKLKKKHVRKRHFIFYVADDSFMPETVAFLGLFVLSTRV